MFNKGLKENEFGFKGLSYDSQLKLGKKKLIKTDITFLVDS